MTKHPPSISWISCSSDHFLFNLKPPTMTTSAKEINQSAMEWFGENYRREPTAFEFAIMIGFVKSFVGKTEQVEAQQ